MSAQGLLDTSVLIASETGRVLASDRIPDTTALSVVTVAELDAGILAAVDIETRSRRLRTRQIAEHFEQLPIDSAVAGAWARLRVEVAHAGRRVGVNDLWIAATAVVQAVPVITQDDDFDVLAELGLIEVIKV